MIHKKALLLLSAVCCVYFFRVELQAQSTSSINEDALVVGIAGSEPFVFETDQKMPC